MRKQEISRFDPELDDMVIKCCICQEIVGMSDFGFGITCIKCHSILTTGGAIFRTEDFPEVLRVGREDLEKISFFHNELDGCAGAVVQVTPKFWNLRKDGVIEFVSPVEEASDDKDL